MSHFSIKGLGGSGGKGAWSTNMELVGMDKIEYIMKHLPNKLAKKAIIKAFRMGARPIVQTAKQKVPISGKKAWMTSHRHISKGVQSTKLRRKRSGDLKRSIGVIVGKDGWTVWVGPSRGGRKEADGWYAHFVEFGTESTGWGKGIKKKTIYASGMGSEQ